MVDKIRVNAIISDGSNISFNTDNITDVEASNLKEVYETSLIPGTNNIYMKVKKYILPIEYLRNTTYNVEE